MNGGRQGHKPPLILYVFSIVLAIAVLTPLLYLFIRTGEIEEGLLSLIMNPRTIGVLLNSAALAAVVTTLSTLIAVPLAFLTIRTDIPFRRILSTGTVLPLVIPSYVGSYAVIAALGPRGSLLQTFLERFGITQLPSIYGWPGAILTMTLFSYPYILLTVRSSLHLLDPSLEEASRTLGLNGRETFFRVTFPHLKPSIAAGSLLVAFYTLSDFGTPSLMRFNSFTRAIYIQYQTSFDRSMAAVLALMLVALATFTLLLEYLARGRARYYGTGSVAKKNIKLIHLGKWRWPALGFCLAILGLSLFLPLGVIFYWLIRGFMTGETLQPILGLAFNSLSVSFSAAAVAVAASLPVAFLSVRYPGKISHAVERASYVGFALPGIVVALSLVFFGIRFAPMLYQTTAMLIFAYVILFIPQAVGTLRSSLLQVSPRLEEASRSLGKTELGAIRSVTLPLIRPGILTGASLVFLTTMKELPATLLLAPIGFNTLATRVWSATDNAFFARAAAPSLLLIAVSTLSMFIILSQEKSKEEWVKQ